MEQTYREAINKASAELSQALRKAIPALLEQGRRLDALVRAILRAVALALLSALSQGLGVHWVQQATARGLTVQRRPIVALKTLFGQVEIASPSLRSAQRGASARPMQDLLGGEGAQYRESVQRALVDCGAEKSFARAAVRFNAPYGGQVGRTPLRHLTFHTAQEAETYVDVRLQDATRTSGSAASASPGVGTMLIALDGCEMRTGVSMTAVEAGRSDRAPQERVRGEHWRDVRTGLARPLDAHERLVVCRLDSSDEVCEQLFGVACGQERSPRPQVVVPGDGAKGLREAVLSVFPGAQYILDRPPLKSHFYATANPLGLEDPERHQWVGGYMHQVWAGEVTEGLGSLQQRHEHAPDERLRQLIDHHLTRCEDRVDDGADHAYGWPLGSREVESAHRSMPQERLKSAGACWNPARVHPMVALRVIRANHWWDACWPWRLERRQAQVGVCDLPKIVDHTRQLLLEMLKVLDRSRSFPTLPRQALELIHGGTISGQEAMTRSGLHEDTCLENAMMVILTFVPEGRCPVKAVCHHTARCRVQRLKVRTSIGDLHPIPRGPAALAANSRI
jgi:hypothetical protein